MSILGPGPIPEGIIMEILDRVADGKATANRMMRELLMEELVHGSSLVYRERSTDRDTFEMHRLVRRFVLADIERGSVLWKNSNRNSLLSVYARIEEVLDNEGYSLEGLPEVFSEQHRQYLPHSLAIVNNYVHPNSPNGEKHNVTELYQVARYSDSSLGFFGNVGEAESMWRSVLTALEGFQGANQNHLHRRWRIGSACFKCFHVAKRSQTDIPSTMRFLGIVLERQGKLIEAEAMYEECLKMDRAIYGDDANHPNTAPTLSQMGLLYRNQGRLEEAEAKYEECLKMKSAIHGKETNHPSIATTLCNMGGLYESQGRLEEAEARYEESLKMKREIHGDDANHPNIATPLNNMGLLYITQGRLEKAEAKYEECLKMQQEIHGDNANHPNIATTLCNMGILYKRQGKLEEAEANYEECLKMDRAIHGDDANHPSIACTLECMGGLYKIQGRLEEAEAKYEESLKMERVIYGDDANHPSIAATLNDMGLSYMTQGRLEEAEAKYDECLKMV